MRGISSGAYAVLIPPIVMPESRRRWRCNKARHAPTAIGWLKHSWRKSAKSFRRMLPRTGYLSDCRTRLLVGRSIPACRPVRPLVPRRNSVGKAPVNGPSVADGGQWPLTRLANSHIRPGPAVQLPTNSVSNGLKSRRPTESSSGSYIDSASSTGSPSELILE